MDLTQNLVSLTTALVKIPSVNGEINQGETAVAKRLQEEATKLGLHSQLLGLEPSRQNLLVNAYVNVKVNTSSFLAKEEEPIPLFLFVGHLDTVAVGDKWSRSPFGEIYEDKIYGRGTGDNKGGAACALYTLAEFERKQEIDLTVNRDEQTVIKKGSIVLAGVVDEESGAQSELGLAYLLSHHQPKVNCKGAIYTYINQTVTIGHRGMQRYIIEVNGESVHSGSQRWNNGTDGANAVTALCEIVYRLEQEPWPQDSSTEDFGDLTLKVTPGTIFNGGIFESIVPNQASIIVDCRTMPETNEDYLSERINAIVKEVIDRRNAQINTNIEKLKSNAKKDKLHYSIKKKNSLPAVALPNGKKHPLALACVNALIKAGMEKEQIKVQGCGPANESYMLMKKNIPTICGFGPIGGNGHAPDEWVDIKSLKETVHIYQDVVIEYMKLIQKS